MAALVKSKGYVMAQKIQSHVRGFLFRVRRKRALARLMSKPVVAKAQEADDMFGDEELDADAFLNIKMENFDQEPDLFAGNDALMDKFIQVMQPTTYSLPPLQKVVTKT